MNSVCETGNRVARLGYADTFQSHFSVCLNIVTVLIRYQKAIKYINNFYRKPEKSVYKMGLCFMFIDTNWYIDYIEYIVVSYVMENSIGVY